MTIMGLGSIKQVVLGALACLVLVTVSGQAAPAARPVDKVLTMGEVRAHSRAESCYIVIEGNVYDVTSALKEHSAKHGYDLAKWCGKESTKGWNEKDGKGSPHSRKALILLRPLRVGVVAEDPEKP